MVLVEEGRLIPPNLFEFENLFEEVSFGRDWVLPMVLGRNLLLKGFLGAEVGASVGWGRGLEGLDRRRVLPRVPPLKRDLDLEL